MDKLDIAILRELTQGHMVLPGRPGITPSHRELARKLRVPPGTLRYRIRRMYISGVIEGSSLFPNPNLLGLKSGAYTVDISPLLQKSDVIQKLRLVEGSSFVHDFLGTLAWVVFIYEDDQVLQGLLEKYNEITGARGIISSIPYPSCPSSLTQTEADILLRLSKEGFVSYNHLAKGLGISVRTVERKLSKLINEDAVVSLPKINYRAIRQSVPADALILFQNKEVARSATDSILHLLGDYTVLAALWDAVGMCSLILPEVAAVTELAEKLRKIPGVAQARVEIVKDHFDQTRVWEKYLEKWIPSRGLKVAPTLT